MSENSITIDGKEYISADRAARLVGYTKDYVGQLARAGKIKTKRIGRSWYIEEDSINKHKLSVHYILTKPKKTYTKKEKETSDININIDISSNPVVNTVQEKKKESDVEYIGPDTEVDLYPRIQDKRGDSLVRSDIRYEQVLSEPARVLTEEERVARQVEGQSFQKNENSSESFKRVTIRKQRAMRPITQRVIAVDGIVTPSHSRMVAQKRVDTFPQKRVIENDKSRKYEYDEYDYEEEGGGEEFHEESSKMIPVIGGIGLFTILVVLYIIFSL